MRNKVNVCVVFCVPVLLILATFVQATHINRAEANTDDVSLRRINAPRFSGSDTIPASQHAIFWFGEVSSNSNHVNGRVAYNDRHLRVVFHIFDQHLWYDRSPSAAEFSNWDSVSLYLDIDGEGTAPGAGTYRFDAQLKAHENGAAYRAAYVGNGNSWQLGSVSFNSESSWRGNGLNNGAGDRGWVVTYEIPFRSLGLSGAPSNGETWKMGVAVHDRDDEAGAPGPDIWWPESAVDASPDSWGELRFGMPVYSPPLAIARGTLSLRHGLNGAVIPDAHVGGHSVCGGPAGPNFFSSCGSLNYADYDQVNIQNQMDVADWPCFSRYYITFPLDQIPPGKVILSATLILHQFGNATATADVPDGPYDSFIQVLTVAEDWNEDTITWNNSPLAMENTVTQRVEPLPGGRSEWPGVPRLWNVSYAAEHALRNNQPLRLVLYSADGAYHSGKYFYSSEADIAARPELRIVWGDLFTGDVQHSYLPLMMVVR